MGSTGIREVPISSKTDEAGFKASEMITYRDYRNSDLPVLVEIWRSRADVHGVCNHVTTEMLAGAALNRPQFDAEGLQIACDDNHPIGFAHAGFGANEDRSDTSTARGTTCMVMVMPGYDHVAIGDQLLARCESYLKGHGAETLYGGSVRPLDPFYHGMYGGSELPGILSTDQPTIDLFHRNGYVEAEQLILMRRNLSGFVAPVDRNQMQIRRRMEVEVTECPPLENWWDAVTVGDFDLTRFQLRQRGGGPIVATAVFRDMQPIGMPTSVRGTGLIDFEIDPSMRRRGYGVFILSEAFRQFVRQGIEFVSVQFHQRHEAAMQLCRKLDFQTIGRGSLFRKDS